MGSWRKALQENNLSFEIDLCKVFKRCVHQFKFERGELVCPLCGLIDTREQSILVDKSVTYEFWPRTYVRKQYFDALFTKIHGREVIQLGTSYLDEFVSEMPEPADWYDIYQHFKSWYLKDWWIAWNILSENSKRITMEKRHYYLLLYVDEMWQESKRAKKKINVFYALYKIVEMTELDCSWVPMKLRAIALTRLDEEWECICKQLNWKFIPTNKKLTKYFWKTNLYV